MNAVLEAPPVTAMKFAREPFSAALVAEMRPLWDAHYSEIAQFKDIPLDPDIVIYKSMVERGLLRIFTARISDILVGYNIFIVAYHPHYRGSLQANQDILFVDEELRKGLTGYKFIKWCDEQLGKEGIQVVYQHIKVRNDFGKMLTRLGYELMDKIYARRLD